LAAGFWPKNLAFARKIMVLPEPGGCSPQPPGSYAYGFRCFYTPTGSGITAYLGFAQPGPGGQGDGKSPNGVQGQSQGLWGKSPNLAEAFYDR